LKCVSITIFRMLGEALHTDKVSKNSFVVLEMSVHHNIPYVR